MLEICDIVDTKNVIDNEIYIPEKNSILIVITRTQNNYVHS